jgi:hypothetical protein
MSLTQVYHPVASRALLSRRAFALPVEGQCPNQLATAGQITYHAIFHDGSVPFESKMDQIIVLSYNLSARTGEVERVRLLGTAKVV